MHGPGVAVARGSDVHMWGAGFRSCGIFRPKSALSAGASVSAGASHQLGLRKVRGIGRPKIQKIKIKVHVFPNAVLGSDVVMLKGALTGGLEMAVSSSPNLTWVVPSLMVFDLPYITSVKYQKNLYEALDNGELGRYFKGKFNEVGLEPIMYCEYGYRDFFSVKKPIRSVADLAGIQVRTTASVVEVEVAKALGMKPKPLAWGETYTALKEGIVEGEGNTFSFLLDAEHEDILRYAFASQHNYSMQILSANKKWWEELDPQVRSIIREAAAEALKYQREVLAPQSEEEAVKRFMADGLEVSKPSEADLEELKRKTRPVWNLFFGLVVTGTH